MDWLNENREAVRKVLSHTCMLFAGLSAGTGWGYYLLNKTVRDMNEASRVRYHTVHSAYKEMNEIENDITLSGEERQRKVSELAEFIDVLIQQDLI